MKQKSIIFSLILLSAFIVSCKNTYYVYQAATDGIWRPEIKVDYIIEADSLSQSKISYTNKSNKQSKVKNQKGSWNKSVRIKNNKKIKYVVNIKNKSTNPTIVKVFLNDKLLKQNRFSDKKRKVVYIFRTF